MKVGESGDAEGSIRTDVIGGSSTNEGRLQGHCSHRLLRIRNNGGKRIAVIESKQVAEAKVSGASASTALRGHFSGVSYFDIDLGAVVRGEYLLDLFTRTNRDTALTGGLVKAHGSVQIDSRFKISLQDTTPAASLASKSAQR